MIRRSAADSASCALPDKPNGLAIEDIDKALDGLDRAIRQSGSRGAQLLAGAAVNGAVATATTTGVMGAVSAVGTASTGTAISTLSGAAATSATQFWIGGLFGLGAVGGGFIVAGASFLVGVTATFLFRARIFGRARGGSDLTARERRIAEASTLLRAALSDAAQRPSAAPEFGRMMGFTLRNLVAEIDALRAERGRRRSLLPDIRLRRAHRVLAKAAKQLAPPKRKGLAPLFGPKAAQPAADRIVATGFCAVGSGVIAALMMGQTGGWSVEEALVLDALRRSTGALAEATDAELGDYLRVLDPQQLRGVMSNVKGVYHELLFERAEDLDGDAIVARLFEATNHPGADVELLDGERVIDTLQLKAVDCVSSVLRHRERYPDICVVATEEVAAKLDWVQGSSFRNAELEREVAETFTDLKDGAAADMSRAAAAGALPVGGALAGAALAVLAGRRSRRDVAVAARDGAAASIVGAIAGAATAAVAG